MDNELKNKVVIVTGGADGIGYGIAAQYLKEAIKVAIILDINEIKGEEAVKNLNTLYGDGKAVYIKCDVTKDLEEVSKKIIDTYKTVDVLVNNAGSVNESSPQETMQLNSIAVMEWGMKFWEHMRKDKGGNGGTILNIGSIYSYVIDPYAVFYTTSKFAVMGFSRTLGHMDNYLKFGVRVLILCPGFTYTSLSNKNGCWGEHISDFNKFVKKQPWQSVEEVGKAALEVFKKGESGSAWNIIGGILGEITLISKFRLT